MRHEIVAYEWTDNSHFWGFKLHFKYQFVISCSIEETYVCMLLSKPHEISHGYFAEAESKLISLQFNQLSWGYTLLSHNPPGPD